MKNITAAEIRRNATNLAPLESQKDYRHRLSEFIRMHTARVEALDSGMSSSSVPGNSMLILARTGCGKSYTAARLAEAAGVEFITIDCSSLTRAGYKGCNLGDLIHAAKKNCKEDSRFERAILFFDEIDKANMDGTSGNPQVNFLKLFDGIIQADPNSSHPETIDVSRMSFLFAGAFSGLEDIILRRTKPRRSIGFQCAPTAGTEIGDPLALATMEDIRDYGFMEELLGRIGSLCYIPPLTVADYRTLLKGSSGSVCSRYNNLLASSGVKLDITNSACEYIAETAGKSPLGARAVDPIVYEKLRPAICQLDEDNTIHRIILSCRNNRLTLRYSHGAPRTPAAYEEDTQKTYEVPDVSISNYLTNLEGIEELGTLLLRIYGRHGTPEEKLLSAFLVCSMLFMSGLAHESDKVLSSLTKLANSTQKDQVEHKSAFDRIIEGEIKKHQPGSNDFLSPLEESYHIFKEMETEKTHDFLVYATQLLRQCWYRSLLNSATCA